MLVGDDPRHGTANGYNNHGCRCDECRAAHTAYWRARRRARGSRYACPNCGGPGGLYADHTCSTCYRYKRVNGVQRPPEVYDPQPIERVCVNCGAEDLDEWARQRCWTCYRYLHRNGRDRPEHLWAADWMPSPPAVQNR